MDPLDVCSVLLHLDAAGTPELRAQIAAAFARSGGAAATALMAPVASAFESIEAGERGRVLDALDTLIRAGGDPADAVPTLARALADARTVPKACVALHRAALAGHSIASVREPLAQASTGGSRRAVRSVERLVALEQRGLHAELRRLRTVHEQQRPIGNLHGGIGVVEDALLSDVDEEVVAARLALTEMERAGSDHHACWMAMLPVLSARVRSPDRERREEAASALGQISFAVRSSSAFARDEAAQRTLPHLHPALDGLTALLAEGGAESVIAARTIESFLEIGCPLGELRPRLDAALADPRVEVRSACSRGLSTALQRAGTEARLSPGRSHRRTYASADTPVEGRGKVRCPSCAGEAAAVIYEWRDRGNTWDETILEIRCPACRLYAVELLGP